MVTESENSTPSTSGAMATLSQNRPIVMPELFAAPRKRRVGLVGRTFQRLCGNKCLKRQTESSVSCSPYPGGSSAPVTGYFGGRTG